MRGLRPVKPVLKSQVSVGRTAFDLHAQNLKRTVRIIKLDSGCRVLKVIVRKNILERFSGNQLLHGIVAPYDLTCCIRKEARNGDAHDDIGRRAGIIQKDAVHPFLNLLGVF